MEVGLLIAIGFALTFALTNGLHDAANAIATLVATRGATPGQAIVRDSDGVSHLVEVQEPMRADWPTRAGVAVPGTLVLSVVSRPSSRVKRNREVTTIWSAWRRMASLTSAIRGSKGRAG